MKILVWIAMIVVALVVLIPPADAKRDGGGDGRDRGGCSKEHWQIVVEREELRLCLLAQPDR